MLRHSGLVAASLAKAHGCYVAATSRSPKSKDLVLSTGADEFILDDGCLEKVVNPNKFNKVLELVGTTTLKDSLRCCASADPQAGLGLVCMMGMAGNSWLLDGFSPMEDIPQYVGLINYSGGPKELALVPWSEIVKDVESGKLKIIVGKTYPLQAIVEAHTVMEEGKAGGKIVLMMNH